MLGKQSFLSVILSAAVLYGSHTLHAADAVAVSKPTTETVEGNVGNKTATFYAHFFMKKMQHAAKFVPSLSDEQKGCVQTLSPNVMLPSFQNAFKTQMSHAELKKSDAVHTATFQSAFIKLTSAKRQNQADSLNLSDAEKAALTHAENSGISKISSIIHSPHLKRQSLALFENAIKSQCGIKKSTP